ncbi:ethylene-responsive transcription factor CRF4-like [Solanum dulcamara]|uniref:ethylene-responsive transcription factor CRF4-like n=1 Tax=Solanum dulcamara TaxID=45834 RepID=UPI0024869606|nr:ethylene-responsive transcription factor CRF4-like [Solanum dulcamara]
MTFKNKHHKKVIRKPSKNDITRKSIVRVEGSSSISSNPVGVYLWGCDLTNPSNEDKGKVKEENEKSHQKEIIVENENVEVISIENSKEKEIKLLQENVKMYKGVRQRKWGKWVAEVYDPRKKGCIWLGTFNTAEEAALVYDKAIIAIKGVNAVTNILKPPQKEINFMNLPSSSLDNARV